MKRYAWLFLVVVLTGCLYAAQDFENINTDEALSLAASKINSNDNSLRSSFSGTASPASAVEGQLWYDTDDEELNVYDGTAWVLLGAGSGSTDHGALTGLADDDHTQYALLDGRSGGQTLVGGTASANNLVLRGTSNATPGDVRVIQSTDFRVYSDNATSQVFGINGATGAVAISASGGAEGIGLTMSGSSGAMSIIHGGSGTGLAIDTTLGSGKGAVIFAASARGIEVTSNTATPLAVFSGSNASTASLLLLDAATSQGATVKAVQVSGPSSTDTFVVQLDGTAYSLNPLWQDFAAASWGVGTTGTWTTSGTKVSTTSDGEFFDFPVVVMPGDVIDEIRVKWQGDNAGDGVAFQLQKRDDSGTGTSWTGVGSTGSADSASVTVTTVTGINETVATGYSYIIRVVAHVGVTGTNVYSAGVKKSKRVL